MSEIQCSFPRCHRVRRAGFNKCQRPNAWLEFLNATKAELQGYSMKERGAEYKRRKKGLFKFRSKTVTRGDYAALCAYHAHRIGGSARRRMSTRRGSKTKTTWSKRASNNNLASGSNRAGSAQRQVSGGRVRNRASRSNGRAMSKSVRSNRASGSNGRAKSKSVRSNRASGTRSKSVRSNRASGSNGRAKSKSMSNRASGSRGRARSKSVRSNRASSARSKPVRSNRPSQASRAGRLNALLADIGRILPGPRKRLGRWIAGPAHSRATRLSRLSASRSIDAPQARDHIKSIEKKGYIGVTAHGKLNGKALRIPKDKIVIMMTAPGVGTFTSLAVETFNDIKKCQKALHGKLRLANKHVYTRAYLPGERMPDLNLNFGGDDERVLRGIFKLPLSREFSLARYGGYNELPTIKELKTRFGKDDLRFTLPPSKRTKTTLHDFIHDKSLPGGVYIFSSCRSGKEHAGKAALIDFRKTYRKLIDEGGDDVVKPLSDRELDAYSETMRRVSTQLVNDRCNWFRLHRKK